MEGRVLQGAAKFDFLLVEGVIILLLRALNDVVLRRIGLHDDPARRVSPSGPSGGLRQELKGPFASPIGRQVEQAVGR